MTIKGFINYKDGKLPFVLEEYKLDAKNVVNEIIEFTKKH